jgi:hypothetical protein
MIDVLMLLWSALNSLFRARVRLEAEILALRQQGRPLVLNQRINTFFSWYLTGIASALNCS